MLRFDALRPLRLGEGQFTGRNAVGPVREKRQCLLRAEPAEGHGHVGLRLTGLEAACPCLDRIVGGSPFLRNRANTLGAERMARLARVLDRVDPIVLRLHHRLDAVALLAGAGEFALVRNLEHRIPIDARIVFRGRGGSRRRYGGQVEILSGRRFHFGRIDQPIAAHPHAVGGLRKVRDHVTAAVVGDHDLGELRGKVGGFRDDPDARLRPVGTGDHAAEIGAADGDRRGRSCWALSPAEAPARHAAMAIATSVRRLLLVFIKLSFRISAEPLQVQRGRISVAA